MTLNWISLLTVIGLSQGVLLAAVLASLSSGNLVANRLLAGFIGVLTINLGVYFLVYTPVEEPYPFFVFRLATIYILAGPLLYFYVLLLVKPDYRFTKRSAIHFVYFPLTFISTYFMSGPEVFQHLPYEQLPVSVKFELATRSVLADLVLLSYAIASLSLLKQHRRHIEQQFSSLEKITLRWLKLFVFLCIATVLLAIIEVLLGMIWSIYPKEARFMSVVTHVILLYGIGFMGLRQPLIFDTAGQRSSESKAEEQEKTPSSDLQTKNPKYQRSGLSSEDEQRYWLKLLSHLESHHTHRTPGLKIGQLAKELGVRDNYLSQVINSCAGKNFFEFINSYRLDEARTLLVEQPQKSITEIALEVGFSSQSAFYNHFKKRENQTPSAYRRNSNRK